MAAALPRLGIGDPVEVHVRFNDSWSSGFEIAVILATGYRIRRTHDRALVPGSTDEHDVRPVEVQPRWA